MSITVVHGSKSHFFKLINIPKNDCNHNYSLDTVKLIQSETLFLIFGNELMVTFDKRITG